MELKEENDKSRIYKLTDNDGFHNAACEGGWSLVCEDPENLSAADLEWAVAGEYYGFSNVELEDRPHRFSIREHCWTERLGEINEWLNIVEVFYLKSPKLDKFVRDYK